jgi:UPF0755 protein
MLVARMSVTAPEAPAEQLPGRHRRARVPWAIVVALLVLAVIAGGALAGLRYYSWCKEAGGPTTPVTFTVPQGASGSQVVSDLHEAGVIRCDLVSKWLLRRSGLEDQILSGTYRLTTNMIPEDAFRALTVAPPPVPTVRLTIPEGYRLTQIAERVQEVLGIPAKRFLAEAESGDRSLPPYLPKGTAIPEGFLFPETYQFARHGTTARDVVERLLAQFETSTADLPWSNAEDLGLTPYEVVIVASMIEKEAKLAEERPVIAGVIYNRLRTEMVLGIDATLLYDDPTPDGQLSYSDLATDTPYNTRINAGLPPTPIASPGLASLEAALNPAKTDYFYYVLCGADGHHEFGRTLAEHTANRAKCGE